MEMQVRKSAVLATITMLVFASAAWPADIRVGLSQREAYVGLPVTLEIEIQNSTQHAPPTLPEVDGLQIQSAGPPSRRSQVSIINGRRSEQSSVTYAFRITPQREGTFTVPSFAVDIDGDQKKTSPLEIVATKSETGDLLFAEIVGKQPSIYVGQGLDLTLKIWLRPFQDKDHDVVLSEAQMWNLISDQTTWGPFAERLEELTKLNQRPVGKKVQRPDDEGQLASYYLYEIDATVYLQRPGTWSGDDVQIVVHYPTRLGTARDPFAGMFGANSFPFPRGLLDDDFFASPFASRLKIQSIRPLVADTMVEPIEVKPIPDAGRPADYRGAVGQYQIVTEAKPTKVQAGDPITLHIGIAGTGPMELVPPPPLAQIEKLTAEFKVPDEPLAGFVDGPQKVFSTSIRPKQAGTSQIPPIPLSYFDPDLREFVTVYSDPIDIEVTAAETLEMSSIIGRGGFDSLRTDTAPQRSLDSSSAGLSLDNYTGAEILNREQPRRGIAPWQWILLATPLLFVTAMTLFRSRHRMVDLADRWRSPLRAARQEISMAEDARGVERAVRRYLQRRLRQPVAPDTTDVAIGTLRQMGLRDFAIRIERLHYRYQEPADLDTLKTDTMETILEVDQSLRRPQRLRSPSHQPTKPTSIEPGQTSPQSSSPAGGTKTLALLVILMSIGTESVIAAEDRRLSLTRDQAVIVLQEANHLYQAARDQLASGAAEASDVARQSAQKYQLLVDAGHVNSKLFFNLANAYQLSGETGRAIANYTRALRIDPLHEAARANLESVLESTPGMVAETAAATTPIKFFRAVHEVATDFISPAAMGGLALTAWIALWTVIAARVLQRSFPWRTVAATATVVFVLTASSYSASMHPFQAPQQAIMMDAEIELRAGDGPDFPAIAHLSQATGRRVRVVNRRGGWVQISAANQVGWVPIDQLEIIDDFMNE
jgi:tetratricopeptide (TPR) repeat protein